MVETHFINTGGFALDGGAMFGVVPRTLWQKSHPPDEFNRIRLALGVLFIKDGPHNLLVDAGAGNYLDEDFQKKYPLENPRFDFKPALARLSQTTETITDVILTHLHFDHAAGIVCCVNGQMRPTFPNARIWLQGQQWQWAQNPAPKDRAGYLDVYLDMLGRSPQLQLIDGPQEITGHVSVVCFHGHTPALQAVLVEAEGETQFFPGDLIPLASHLRVPSIMAYDNHPLVTAQEKETILARAAAGHWLVYFQHDPVIEKGYVTRENDVFVLEGRASNR